MHVNKCHATAFSHVITQMTIGPGLHVGLFSQTFKLKLYIYFKLHAISLYNIFLHVFAFIFEHIFLPYILDEQE